MSFADDTPRRRRMPVLSKATSKAGPAGDGAPEDAQGTASAVSGRMRAMLGAASPDGPEARAAGPDATDAAVEEGASVESQAAGETIEPDTDNAAAQLRATRELRPAISALPEPEETERVIQRTEEADPAAPGNRAISLAIRLGSMMAVVLTGVFAATLIDLALGLQTRFQGLGILATYLVVLAVILTPSLNPRTPRQWIVVIGGFAGVICAIALGSAVARLMLMTKDFQHTGLYVHLAVEFGVMFAFWGLAALVFVEILRRAGINIGSQQGDPR